ncbi:hypothetical protein [Candidatus Cardinium hertigii]|uniref:Uncharacterized protein n=1 Tax=Candidatus Cardinium hertigii TaxID=247481 RepID=A0A2Z3LEV2_9BACT|nr:hypothetical protein [Candidatus Cardinium hertigii]AWN82216.1 hypothetical protein DK880_00918 [Candidatus Cardinium hertigii]
MFKCTKNTHLKKGLPLYCFFSTLILAGDCDKKYSPGSKVAPTKPGPAPGPGKANQTPPPPKTTPAGGGSTSTTI